MPTALILIPWLVTLPLVPMAVVSLNALVDNPVAVPMDAVAMNAWHTWVSADGAK